MFAYVFRRSDLTPYVVIIIARCPSGVPHKYRSPDRKTQ